MKSLVTAKINVDEAAGSKLAQRIGVFSEGIPNIRVFTKQSHSNGFSIMSGND